MADTKYIQDSGTLEKVCSHLLKSSYVAIDTEFVRENYYYPHAGIIQIASDDICSIIDVLAIENLSCLRDVIIAPSVTKVFHAGKEDLSVFYTIFQKIPKPIFDTQIAASLVGYEEQISYSKLVKLITGVNLQKNETYTDWLQRPLSREQIKYAMNDVRYLTDVYFHLDRLLKEMGRHTWAGEEFENIEQEENYTPKDIEIKYVKMLNSNGIKPQSRSILINLLAWREDKARELDKTRKYILKDEVVINVARRVPSSMNDLKSVPGLFPNTITRYGEEILEAVKKGKSQSKSKKKIKKIYKIPSGLVSLLTAFIKKRAEEENIAYGIIASRDDIEKFIYNYLSGEEYETPLMKGWRREFVGEHLLQIIAGRVSLGFSPKNEQVIVLPNPT